MTKDEEKQAILKALNAPQSYSVDGESVTQRSASDQLTLLKAYKKAGLNTKNAFRALGTFKVSTAGTNEK